MVVTEEELNIWHRMAIDRMFSYTFYHFHTHRNFSAKKTENYILLQ